MLSWLNFLYVFIIGYTPINNEILVDGPSEFLNYNLIYTDLSLSIGVKNFYLNGGVKTTTKPVAITTYLPLQDYYSVGCNYIFKINDRSSLNLNYAHECQHTINAVIQNTPCHRDGSKDEIDLYWSLKGDWYKMVAGIGYIPKQGQTYIGKTYCYIAEYDSIKYYAGLDDFDYRQERHNDFLVDISFEVEYKNFYNVISSRDIFDYDYAASYGLGYRVHGERVSVDIGANLIGRQVKRLNKNGDMKFIDYSKCEVFVKLYK